MTDKKTLLDLAERAEAGEILTETCNAKDVRVLQQLIPGGFMHLERVLVRGSLDAALALHDTVLPGWAVLVSYTDKTTIVVVHEPSPDPVTQGREWDGTASNPAAAWFAADLRAKAEVMGND